MSSTTALGTRLKRFYKQATAAPTAAGEEPAGFVVLLDGKRLKTPAGRPLVLAQRAVAEALAAEWEAQEGDIQPRAMPLMRLVSTALDRVPTRREAVLDEIAGYGETDLVCYRVDHPPELARRQQMLWQPLVDWVTLHYDAPLSITTGILPLAQPAAALDALRAAAARLDDFRLTGLHAAATACGSLVLGLALLERRVTPEAACEAAQLEENWQIEHWGEDAEMAERRSLVRAEIEAASRYLSLLRGA